MTTYCSGKNTYAVARMIPVATVMTTHVTVSMTFLQSAFNHSITALNALHDDIPSFVPKSACASFDMHFSCQVSRCHRNSTVIGMIRRLPQ